VVQEGEDLLCQEGASEEAVHKESFQEEVASVHFHSWMPQIIHTGIWKHLRWILILQYHLVKYGEYQTLRENHYSKIRPLRPESLPND
jgi:hypothetical protein